MIILDYTIFFIPFLKMLAAQTAVKIYTYYEFSHM